MRVLAPESSGSPASAKLADGAGNKQELPAALRTSVLQTLGEEAVRYLPRS